MKEKNDNGSSKKKSVRVSTALISEVFALKKIGIPAKDVAIELGLSADLAKRIWDKCDIKSSKKPRVKDITGSTSKEKKSSEKSRGTKKTSNVETANDGIMKLGAKDVQSISKSTKKPRGKTKKSASTGKSNTRGKTKKAGNEVSKKEKVAYCNRVYGKGTWRFMTKREFIEYMMVEIEMNSDLRY